MTPIHSPDLSLWDFHVSGSLNKVLMDYSFGPDKDRKAAAAQGIHWMGCSCPKVHRDFLMAPTPTPENNS
jgi:hypothetical protein